MKHQTPENCEIAHCNTTSKVHTVTQTSNIQYRAGHEPVCFVPRPRHACALLEFAQALTHILRVSLMWPDLASQ